jgi:hypothetical protein
MGNYRFRDALISIPLSSDRAEGHGGFRPKAVRCASTSIDKLAPYNPQRDDTYEIGLKTSWLNGHPTAKTAVFHNEIKNLQALDVPTINNIAFFFVRSAAGLDEGRRRPGSLLKGRALRGANGHHLEQCCRQRHCSSEPVNATSPIKAPSTACVRR